MKIEIKYLSLVTIILFTISCTSDVHERELLYINYYSYSSPFEVKGISKNHHYVLESEEIEKNSARGACGRHDIIKLRYKTLNGHTDFYFYNEQLASVYIYPSNKLDIENKKYDSNVNFYKAKNADGEVYFAFEDKVLDKENTEWIFNCT